MWMSSSFRRLYEVTWDRFILLSLWQNQELALQMSTAIQRTSVQVRGLGLEFAHMIFWVHPISWWVSFRFWWLTWPALSRLLETRASHCSGRYECQGSGLASNGTRGISKTRPGNGSWNNHQPQSQCSSGLVQLLARRFGSQRSTCVIGCQGFSRKVRNGSQGRKNKSIVVVAVVCHRGN